MCHIVRNMPPYSFAIPESCFLHSPVTQTVQGAASINVRRVFPFHLHSYYKCLFFLKIINNTIMLGTPMRPDSKIHKWMRLNWAERCLFTLFKSRPQSYISDRQWQPLSTNRISQIIWAVRARSTFVSVKLDHIPSDLPSTGLLELSGTSWLKDDFSFGWTRN